MVLKSLELLVRAKPKLVVGGAPARLGRVANLSVKNLSFACFSFISIDVRFVSLPSAPQTFGDCFVDTLRGLQTAPSRHPERVCGIESEEWLFLLHQHSCSCFLFRSLAAQKVLV